MSDSKIFVLVHGAWHGSWCWDRLTPFLVAQGHSVRTLSLPGREGNKTPGWRISMKNYTDAVLGLVREAEKPVVAVGHSLGGQVISIAAEEEAGLFERLIYVSAILPRNGDSSVSLFKTDNESILNDALKVNLLAGRTTGRPDGCPRVLYNDCTDEDIQYALRRLVPESIRPSFAKASLSEDSFGKIEKSYIRCLNDHAISIALQDRMSKNWHCDKIGTLDASHSPFISQPKELAKVLLKVC